MRGSEGAAERAPRVGFQEGGEWDYDRGVADKAAADVLKPHPEPEEVRQTGDQTSGRESARARGGEGESVTPGQEAPGICFVRILG